MLKYFSCSKNFLTNRFNLNMEIWAIKLRILHYLPVPGGSVVAEAARVWMIGEVTAAAAGLDAVGPKELETGESASVDSRAEGVACGGSDEGLEVGDSCMSTTLRCSSRACEPISHCNRHAQRPFHKKSDSIIGK